MGKTDVSQVKNTFIDQLNLFANPVPQKESKDKRNIEFGQYEIPNVFHRIYDVANFMGAREAQSEMLVRVTEQIGKEHSSDPLLGRQMLDIMNQRREYYMKLMIRLLELSMKSKSDAKKEQK